MAAVANIRERGHSSSKDAMEAETKKTARQVCNTADFLRSILIQTVANNARPIVVNKTTAGLGTMLAWLSRSA
jgi:hypothetical protein